MGRKSYKVESEVKVDTICVPRADMCPLDHVYLNLELFGETQRSKLFHPVFPIKTSDKFYFTKTFWSPQNEEELHKLMRESPVSVELRHLQPGSKDSSLFAFTDTDAYRFLIEGACSNYKGVYTTEKHAYLTRSKYSCGQLPCVKVEIKSTVSSSPTPIMDKWLDSDMDLCPLCDNFCLKKSHVPAGGTNVRSHCDMYTCKCELHKVKDDHKFHCSVCHQDLNFSFHTKRFKNDNKLNEDEYTQDFENFEEWKTDDDPGRMRPPFVVRKVASDIIGRKPDAFDSVYNGTMREQEQLKSSRNKKLHRLRSCSPKKDKNVKKISNSEICYACSLSSSKERLSCESCNLTYRGEPPYRCGDLVRPEPPMLRTHRETVDQKPLYPINEIKCSRCIRLKTQHPDTSPDNILMSSTKPIYKMQGYQDMAKYFSCHDLRQY